MTLEQRFIQSYFCLGLSLSFISSHQVVEVCSKVAALDYYLSLRLCSRPYQAMKVRVIDVSSFIFCVNLSQHKMRALLFGLYFSQLVSCIARK